MRVLVEQDHRVRADDRLQNLRALAWMQHVGWRLEDLLDLLGVGYDDERRLAEQADREAPAMVGAGAPHESRGTTPPANRLQQRRHSRPGRQLTIHRGSSRAIECGTECTHSTPTACDTAHTAPRAGSLIASRTWGWPIFTEGVPASWRSATSKGC